MRRRKDQVRVAIHKTGHHNPARGVDLDRAAGGGQIFDAPGRAGFDHNSVTNE